MGVRGRRGGGVSRLVWNARDRQHPGVRTENLPRPGRSPARRCQQTAPGAGCWPVCFAASGYVHVTPRCTHHENQWASTEHQHAVLPRQSTCGKPSMAAQNAPAHDAAQLIWTGCQADLTRLARKATTSLTQAPKLFNQAPSDLIATNSLRILSQCIS
jgi:hypothetical protein